MFKHLHIVACSPRSGTTLLHEAMVTCFKVDKHYDHEVRFNLVTANDGDIVVAILEDEEATLKRFYRESNGMIRLQPANSEMEPLFTNRVQLRGVVRGVIRKFR